MTQPLSQRLEEGIELVWAHDVIPSDLSALLSEAAQLAKRVEDAKTGKVECCDAKGAWLIMADDLRLKPGVRVALVTLEEP